MASSSGSALNEELQCSICLEVFTDPVTTPCGHNFCRTCLSKCWTNTQTCFCPFCKEEFSKSPDLKINTTLRDVAQLFKKLNLGESEVFFDERKQKAVENLEDYKCKKHERPLEMFCRDDQTCVCLFCTEGDHRNHNTVSIEEESTAKKLEVMKKQGDLQQMIRERMEKIREIQDSVEKRKRITEKEKSSSVELFTDLIRFIERCQSEHVKMMEEQHKAAEKKAEDLIKELQQEITELKKKNTELEQLLHTDHLHIIQMDPSQFNHPDTKDWTKIKTDSDVDVNSLYTALTELKKTLDGTLNKKLRQTGIKTAQTYAVDVTLDPDTANRYLILSNDGKEVRHGDIRQKVLKTPKRFDFIVCVLAKEGFSSGRFYYEVQVKGKIGWELGVARESINRKGQIRLSPVNGYWTVVLRKGNQYSACDDPFVSLTLKVNPEKLGVFVDYEEGLVSFYDVDSRSLIYSFTGQTFTDKLYPYLNPGYNDEGNNSKPLIITPVS